MKRLGVCLALFLAVAAFSASAGASRSPLRPTSRKHGSALPASGRPALPKPAVPSYCSPCLYYSGDVNPESPLADGLWNANNLFFGISGSVYAPVTPDRDWIVTGLFANEQAAPGTQIAPSTPWEIRTDVSAGDGGAISASGTSTATTWTPTGRILFGKTEYTALLPLSPAVLLHQGVTYWINVLPQTSDPTAGPYESNIDGGGANHYGPLNDLGESFFTSPFFGFDFANANDLGPFDGFSFGLTGHPRLYKV